MASLSLPCMLKLMIQDFVNDLLQTITLFLIYVALGLRQNVSDFFSIFAGNILRLGEKKVGGTCTRTRV